MDNAALVLKPIQVADLNAWLALPRPRVLWNNNAPGLGKTVDGIVCWRDCGYARVLIICLASSRQNWLEHADAWYPEHPTLALIEEGINRKNRSKPAQARAEATLTAAGHVVSYELLPQLLSALKARGSLRDFYDYIIIDEFHTVKNRHAACFKAIHEIRQLCPKADLKPLSGTPAGNDPLRMWPWLDLSEPGKWHGRAYGKSLFPRPFGAMYGNALESEYAFSGTIYRGVREDRLPLFRHRISRLVRRSTLADAGIHVPYSIKAIQYIEALGAPAAAVDWLAQRPDCTVVVCTHNIDNIHAIASEAARRGVAFMLLADGDPPKARQEKCRQALAQRIPVLTTTGLISTGINFLADVHEWLLAQPSKDIDEVEQLTGRFLRLSSEDAQPRTGYLLYDSATAYAAKLALNERLRIAHALQKATAIGTELQAATGQNQVDLLSILEQLGAELAAFGADDDSADDEE